MSPHRPSLVRRVLPAIALTAIGSGMVHALDRPEPVAANENVLPTVDPNTAIVTTLPGNTVPLTIPPVEQGAVPQSSVPATAAPQTVAPQGNSSTSNDCGAMTGTGAQATIQWRRVYGVITVTAKFTSSGVLCDSSATYNMYDNRSVRYSERSVPVLNQQAVAAGSANINGVSGATAVSDAYRSSLQSAIDNKR
jgi:hypothetical protein